MFPFDSHVLSLILEALVLGGGLVGMYFTLKANQKEAEKDIEELKRGRSLSDKDATEFKLTVAKDYVSKVDLGAVESRLVKSLDEIKALVAALIPRRAQP